MRRAIVVDDDPNVASFVADMLRYAGCEVVAVCESGPEVLDKMAGGLRADMIVSDHDMSSMTGRELFEILGVREPELKKIMVTGNEEAAKDLAGRWPVVLKGSSGFVEELLSAVEQSLCNCVQAC